MAAEPKIALTVQDYLDIERESETKHEYLDGAIVAMVGASPAHNRIQTSLIAQLYPRLRRQSCEIFGGDMRVRIERLNMYTYPDLSVVCGTPTFIGPAPDALLKPTLLVEILSPSTEMYDRVKKFWRYRQLPSLREYVLIAQDRPMIEHYIRQDDGTWNWSAAEELGGTIALPTIGCTLELAEVYEQVTFPPEEANESGAS